MRFEEAFTRMVDKERRVARKKWGGKSFIVMMPYLSLAARDSESDTGPKVNDRVARHVGPKTNVLSRPYIARIDGGSSLQPGWLPSQEDLFADDWFDCEESQQPETKPEQTPAFTEGERNLADWVAENAHKMSDAFEMAHRNYIADRLKKLLGLVVKFPRSRENSLTATKLEEALMWFERGNPKKDSESKEQD